MCCLTCAYFEPTEPEAHKIARQSGQCEAACGKEWDWHTAFHYTRAHREEPLHGICRQTPAGTKKESWGACAQHRLVLSKDNGWGLRGFEFDDRSLTDWAKKQFQIIRDDADPYHTRFYQKRATELEEQNKALRNQLAAARKRSAGRLARLQKAAKQKPQASRPLEPIPPQLRLVAAE